jgi:hypothetical protein
VTLGKDESITLPGGEHYLIEKASDDLCLLEVTLPASFEMMAT